MCGLDKPRGDVSRRRGGRVAWGLWVVAAAVALAAVGVVSGAVADGAGWWPQDIEVTAEVEGEVGPFAHVRYELRQTKAGVTFSAERSYYGEFRQDTGLSLLNPGQLTALRAALGRCVALEALQGDVARSGVGWSEGAQARYRVRWRSGGASGERAQGAGEDGRGEVRCAVRVMQRAAAAYLDPLLFDMAFITRDEAGYIDVMTRPAAQIWVDDVPVSEPTPLWHHPVVAGVRTVTIRHAGLGVEQSFELRVEPGGTTAIELDLLR
jgi:hypothetical protein